MHGVYSCYFLVALESHILYIKCAFEVELIHAGFKQIARKVAELFTCLCSSTQPGISKIR